LTGVKTILEDGEREYVGRDLEVGSRRYEEDGEDLVNSQKS
jgi:hypothetical protein